MLLAKRSHRPGFDLSVGDVLRFDVIRASRVASRSYSEWKVTRIFRGSDQRNYLRLTASNDVTVTKLISFLVLQSERFSVVPGQEPETPLPLRSRKALAALSAVAAAAE